ncbi:hypothetical protein BH23ACT12_BH23ACT12_04940 [soil metagenome]
MLRNPTYVGKLPFNGNVFEAGHDPIVEEALFKQVQELLNERAGEYDQRASNATKYLLTSLLRCSRCGHGFIGTSATGKNGRYRYYTCYCRQRQGTADAISNASRLTDWRTQSWPKLSWP